MNALLSRRPHVIVAAAASVSLEVILLVAVWIAFGSISAAIPNAQAVLDVGFPFFLAMASLNVAVLVLLYQLFYDRHPFPGIRRVFDRDAAIVVSLTVLLGSALLVSWVLQEPPSWLLAAVSSLVVAEFIVFFTFLVSYRSFDVREHIRSVGNRGVLKIERNKLSESDLSDALSLLQGYFTESIERDESVFVSTAIGSLMQIAIAYIANRDRLYLRGNHSPNELLKLDEEIVQLAAYCYYRIIPRHDRRSEQRAVAKLFSELLDATVKCEKKHLHEELITRLSLALSESVSSRSARTTFDIMTLLVSSREFLGESRGDDHSWMNQTDEQLQAMLVYSEIFAGGTDDSRREILSGLSKVLDHSLRQSDDAYAAFSARFYDGIRFVTPRLVDRELEFFFALLSAHGRELSKAARVAPTTSFVDSLTQLIHMGLRDRRRALVLQSATVLRYLEGECEANTLPADFDQRLCDLTHIVIPVFPEIASVLMPAFSEQMHESNSSDQIARLVADHYKGFLNRLIRVGEAKHAHLFFSSLEKIVTALNKQRP